MILLYKFIINLSAFLFLEKTSPSDLIIRIVPNQRAPFFRNFLDFMNNHYAYLSF